MQIKMRCHFSVDEHPKAVPFLVKIPSPGKGGAERARGKGGHRGVYGHSL